MASDEKRRRNADAHELHEADAMAGALAEPGGGDVGRCCDQRCVAAEAGPER